MTLHMARRAGVIGRLSESNLQGSVTQFLANHSSQRTFAIKLGHTRSDTLCLIAGHKERFEAPPLNVALSKVYPFRQIHGINMYLVCADDIRLWTSNDQFKAANHTIQSALNPLASNFSGISSPSRPPSQNTSIVDLLLALGIPVFNESCRSVFWVSQSIRNVTLCPNKKHSSS